MTKNGIDEQLVKYLADAHSIEEQALQQLRSAPEAAGDEELARVLREHLAETEGHEQAVRARLEAHGGGPSRFKDLLMRIGGEGFVLFARAQPDTPGKLLSHAYSYEHLELASYELLARVAERAGDRETVSVARRIRDEEQRMSERLAGTYDSVVEASLAEVGADDVNEQLNKYLADAHAIEAQAVELLERAAGEADDAELAGLYRAHLVETRAQQQKIEERLSSRGARPSALKDAALRLGGLNWSMFFEAHPDTPGKLVAFAYAFEHLEISGYEQLKRVAQRAGDAEAVRVCGVILEQERAAAQKLASAFDRAVDVALEAVGVR
jgi:ferritin-like metal-binding protein YciE